MELRTVVEAGVVAVEAAPDAALMSTVDDARRVIEVCFAKGTNAVLLYAPNLTGRFFDLSSGEAGAILQTLRNYDVRLAVVCAPGAVDFSRRFGEMLAEQRRGRHFGVFETRRAAWEWLAA